MDWKEISSLLNEQIKKHVTLETGYKQISSYLEKNNLPIPSINLDDLKTEFKNSIKEVITKEPIPKNIKSIYIGLITMTFPEIAPNQEKTTLHIMGSSKTPIEDVEWACYPDFIPKRRYFLLSEFEKIDQVKNENELSGKFEVLVFNGLLNLLILSTVNELKDKLLTYKETKFGVFKTLKTRESIYLGAGFDSGDVSVVSHLKHEI